MRHLNEIKEGESVVEHYLCKSRQTLKSRTGKNYLSLKLQDKTGVVDAKVWELTNDIKSFEENDFIKVDASAVVYLNEIQLSVKKIRRSMEGEYDPLDYIPASDKDINSMYTEFLGYINTIKNPYIKRLLDEVFIKDEVISKKFSTHSAAKNIHHGFMGGLVEHSLSVTQICDFMSTRYKNINRDILVASAMLHDVGKIYELSDFPINDYTDDGELLGHLIIGSELIGETTAKIEGFPKQLTSLLKHCMLAHHGQYEYGSPKLPKTIEAFILHCADDMDAKTKIFEEMLEGDNTQGNWVGYQKMFQRNIRNSEF